MSRAKDKCTQGCNTVLVNSISRARQKATVCMAQHWFWSHFLSPDDRLLLLLGKSWENKNVLLISDWLFFLHKHRVCCCHVVWNNINILLHWLCNTKNKILIATFTPWFNWIAKTFEFVALSRGCILTNTLPLPAVMKIKNNEFICISKRIKSWWPDIFLKELDYSLQLKLTWMSRVAEIMNVSCQQDWLATYWTTKGFYSSEYDIHVILQVLNIAVF